MNSWAARYTDLCDVGQGGWALHCLLPLLPGAGLCKVERDLVMMTAKDCQCCFSMSAAEALHDIYKEWCEAIVPCSYSMGLSC